MTVDMVPGDAMGSSRASADAPGPRPDLLSRPPADPRVDLPAGPQHGSPAGQRPGELDRSYPSLSPSRAADFKTCPLLYRFRTIDRLPEQTSPDQARGTLVHAVLERLFDLEPADRTPAAAAELVGPQWERLVAEHPELANLFATGTAEPDTAQPDTAADPAGVADTAVGAVTASPAGAAGTGVGAVTDDATAAPPSAAEFLDSARGLLAGYFAVEDPRRLEPAERESLISAVVDEQLLLRGYVDRLDVAPSGDLRVVDYKTGGAPREAFEARALFQLKFYALVLWRTRGVVPRVLRLLYLKDAEACDYSPDAEELVRFERNLLALWRAIERAGQTRDFRPKPSRLCGWCSHQAVCPAYGGTPPPYPEPATAEDTAPATAEDTAPATAEGAAPFTAEGAEAAAGSGVSIP